MAPRLKVYCFVILVILITITVVVYTKTTNTTNNLEKQIVEIKEVIDKLKNNNIIIESKIKNVVETKINDISIRLKDILIVRVSWYNPEDMYQTDDTPNICAWGYEVKPGDRIIAVSPDLLKDGIVKKGDEVIVGEFGKFTVQDKMNVRYTRSIDIAITNPDFPNLESLVERKKEARKNGVQKCTLIVFNRC